MNDSTIWRYLDLAKFIDLISSRQLYFCRSDQLGDPFEGSIPKKTADRRWAEIQEQSKDFEREIALYKAAGEQIRKYVFVNCWHMSEHESAALWALYAGSNTGIAIRSTRSRLGSSLVNSKPGIWQVPVFYIDYDNDEIPSLTRWAPFRFKRKSFAHEKELRAVAFTDVYDDQGNLPPPSEEMGLKIPVDLKKLILDIYISPMAPVWCHDLIIRTCNKFNVSAMVIKSRLADDRPIFT